MPRIISLWKDSLAKISEKAAQSLADPMNYENLFPDYQDTLRAEQFIKQERGVTIPAKDYPNLVSEFCIILSINFILLDFL